MSGRGFLAACCIARFEHFYIAEWIGHHRAIGVERYGAGGLARALARLRLERPSNEAGRRGRGSHVRRARRSFKANRLVKSIVRPRDVLRATAAIASCTGTDARSSTSSARRCGTAPARTRAGRSS
jgi:hypothetical protein